MAAGAPAPTTLRLATYNLAHGRGLAASNWEGGDEEERLRRLAKLAEVLRDSRADVVVLNEVDFDSSWSHSVNQAAWLAQAAGYPHWAEERNLDLRFLFWTWRFGNAILSRYPIVDAAVVDLPAFAVWETWAAGKKRAIRCDLQVGDGIVRVVGAHLSHRSERVRVESAIVIGELANTSPFPVILLGDLNSTPPGFPDSHVDAVGRNAIAQLDATGVFERTLTATPPTAADFTFHAADPRAVIDWILIPPVWKFESYEVGDATWSDHRPVVAEVSWDEWTSSANPAAPQAR